MNLKACALTLLLAGAGFAAAQSRVLYDNRLSTPAPRLTEAERERIRSLAEKAAEGRLWDDDNFRLPEYCKSKDIEINGAVPGSFTAVSVRQIAYLYTYCWHDRRGNSQGIIVMQGLTPVAHYVFTNQYWDLYAVKDINKNGFSELALEGSTYGQGLLEKWIDFAEIAPVRNYLAQLTVYKDNCQATGRAGITGDQLKWHSQVIRVTPGITPRYTAQTINGSCESEGVATKVGSVRPIPVKATPTGWTPAPLK